MTIPIISADDHVIEPPNLWQDRLPKALIERGPKVLSHPRDAVIFDQQTRAWELLPGGTEAPAAFWSFDGLIKPLTRAEASPGTDPGVHGRQPVSFEEIRRGCWDPVARLADMDVNGVEAAMCFPNYPRFCGQLFSETEDRELGLACINAYNDWMLEEWCGGSGGRLIPLCIVPLWDAELAAAEVRRTAELGARSVAFSEVPAWLGMPSPHSGFWDPFFRACEETSTVISMHIGSGSRILTSSADAPVAVGTVMIFNNSALSMVDLLSAGILDRFPDLKLFFAEAQMGWLPYVLERADDVFARQRWAYPESLKAPPSEYYRRHVSLCFYSDPAGIAQLDRIGVDQALFETDYPHESGTWPNTRAVVEEELGHLPVEVQRKLLRGNAIRLFNLDLEP